ncbi:MAG TPA: hypothetical protein VGD54_20200 [Steroidobacteraceae bacterium]
MADDSSALVAGRRKRIEHGLNQLPLTLQILYARSDLARVGHNIDSTTRSLLQRGMMSARIDGDFKAARADFTQAAQLSREFDRALTASRESLGDAAQPKSSRLYLGDFEVPLFACVLAHNWPQAEWLATTLHDRQVGDPVEDPIHSHMTRLLAALVLDDRATFVQAKSSYDKLKKSAWWKYFVHYVDLYESVLTRDQARYDERVALADTNYRARARDRKFGDLRPEYGGLSDNERMLDFVALAIAIVAMKRGMGPKESDIVPAALIEP